MKLNKQNKKGFTIVELVIVIAVIGILSAILIPTFANLTNEAQKAARKQQAADAYTAYLVEATDSKHDSYLDYDGASTYKDVAIARKAQDEVAINLKGTNFWFTYDAEKGWQEAEAQPTNYDKAVVAALTGSHKFVNNDEGKTALAEDFSNLDASTFNNSVVYYK